LVAGADGRLDVRGRLGEHDERGNDAAPGQPVALVRAELLRLANELVVTERRLEGGLESRIEHHGRRYRGSASRWWTSAAARTPLRRAPSIRPCRRRMLPGERERADGDVFRTIRSNPEATFGFVLDAVGRPAQPGTSTP